MSKTTQIPSARELSRRIGRSHSSVCEWLHRADWPFKLPPWPATILPRVRAWMERLRPAPSAPPDPDISAAKRQKLVESIRLLSLQADAAEAVAARARASIIDRAEAEQGLRCRIHAVRSAMHAAGRRILARIDNTLPQDYERMLTEEFDRVCEEFAKQGG